MVNDVNKVRPPEQVINYFKALGFDYHVITDSIYIDKRDAPVHFFQTDSKFHTQYCSTIMADDAINIFNNVSEPFSKKVEKAFGAHCKNGHILSASDCKSCKKPDGRSVKSNYKRGRSVVS